MAENRHNDPEVVIEKALSNWEQWIENNGKKLVWALVAVAILVGAFFAYTHLYKNPQEEQASSAMFEAQMLLNENNYELALKGDDKVVGFESIINQYGGTQQANLAYHYSGICNLYLGNFQAAIDAFAKFDNVGGTLGQIVTAQNLGMTGDAYVELGNLEKGLEFYTKAAKEFKNDDTTPKYLFKAAGVCVKLGKTQEAIGMYKDIKQNFPASMLARDIDKYIANLQQL